jgi:hypothetical protein
MGQDIAVETETRRKLSVAESVNNGLGKRSIIFQTSRYAHNLSFTLVGVLQNAPDVKGCINLPIIM